MPYDTKKLKAKAVETITKNKLIFIEDVCAMIGISKPTFYDHFKEGSDDSNELKEMIAQNKIRLKVSIRKKWFDKESDTGLMALYKLCSTSEEHEKLTQIRQTLSGDADNPLTSKIEITFVDGK